MGGSIPLFCADLARLAATDPGRFCEVMYRLGEDLRGQGARPAGPYGRAAAEAGLALSDAALRYGRVADDTAAALAEGAAEVA